MSEKEFPTLTIKGKIDFPYLLARQIITYQQAILNTEHSQREIQEAINGLVEMLPASWKDAEWEKEIKEAEVEEKVDVAPLVAGSIRMNEETCLSLGIPKWKIVKTNDSNKLFHSCIDLLDRRGMLSRVTKIEKMLGERFEPDGYEKDH